MRIAPAPILTLTRFAGLLALSLAWGCGERGASDEAPPRQDSAVASSGVEATPARAPWYDRSRLLDVTGDGTPDSLRLSARGPRIDSLDIRLVVRADGRTVHEESWRSGYELMGAPGLDSAGPEREARLRGLLDTVLARARTKPFDSTRLTGRWGADCVESARACIAWELREEAAGIDWENLSPGDAGEAFAAIRRQPVDSAQVERIVAGMRERKLPFLALAYGYETYKILGWDPERGRFWTLHECC